jgi:hypothetical protein
MAAGHGFWQENVFRSWYFKKILLRQCVLFWDKLKTINTRLPSSNLLCDNLKKRKFLQNIFSFWEFVMFFQLSKSFNYSNL